eukprot:g11376.t1
MTSPVHHPHQNNHPPDGGFSGSKISRLSAHLHVASLHQASRRKPTVLEPVGEPPGAGVQQQRGGAGTLQQRVQQPGAAALAGMRKPRRPHTMQHASGHKKLSSPTGVAVDAPYGWSPLSGASSSPFKEEGGGALDSAGLPLDFDPEPPSGDRAGGARQGPRGSVLGPSGTPPGVFRQKQHHHHHHLARSRRSDASQTAEQHAALADGAMNMMMARGVPESVTNTAADVDPSRRGLKSPSIKVLNATPSPRGDGDLVPCSPNVLLMPLPRSPKPRRDGGRLLSSGTASPEPGKIFMNIVSAGSGVAAGATSSSRSAESAPQGQQSNSTEVSAREAEKERAASRNNNSCVPSPTRGGGGNQGSNPRMLSRNNYVNSPAAGAGNFLESSDGAVHLGEGVPASGGVSLPAFEQSGSSCSAAVRGSEQSPFHLAGVSTPTGRRASRPRGQQPTSNKADQSTKPSTQVEAEQGGTPPLLLITKEGVAASPVAMTASEELVLLSAASSPVRPSVGGPMLISSVQRGAADSAVDRGGPGGLARTPSSPSKRGPAAAARDRGTSDHFLRPTSSAFLQPDHPFLTADERGIVRSELPSSLRAGQNVVDNSLSISSLSAVRTIGENTAGANRSGPASRGMPRARPHGLNFGDEYNVLPRTGSGGATRAGAAPLGTRGGGPIEDDAALRLRHEKAVSKSAENSSSSLLLQRNNSLLSTAVEKLLSSEQNSRSRLVTSPGNLAARQHTVPLTTADLLDYEGSAGGTTLEAALAPTKATSGFEQQTTPTRPTSANQHGRAYAGDSTGRRDSTVTRRDSSIGGSNPLGGTSSTQRGNRTAIADYVRVFRTGDGDFSVADLQLLLESEATASSTSTAANKATLAATSPAVHPHIAAANASEDARKLQMCKSLSKMRWFPKSAGTKELFLRKQDVPLTPRGANMKRTPKPGAAVLGEQQVQLLTASCKSPTRPGSRTQSEEGFSDVASSAGEDRRVQISSVEQSIPGTANGAQAQTQMSSKPQAASSAPAAKPKTKKGRIAANRHPQSDCVALVQSVFPNHLPPSLYFEYPNQLPLPRVPPAWGTTPRQQESAVLKTTAPDGGQILHTDDNYHRNARIFKCLNPRRMPAMYWLHTSKVHVYNCVLNSLKKGGLFHVDSKKESSTTHAKYCLVWTTHMKPEKLRQFHPLQKTNHFPYSWYLGRKDLMCRGLMRMRRTHPAEYDLTPDTFVLPEDARKFLDGVKNPENRNRGAHRDLWISKPVNSSCGRGVKIIGAHSTGLERMAKQYRVVQRYVNPPLLIKGYKFDLRLYVVVTSFDPLKVYLFKEGLVRFATEKYTTERRSDLRSRKVHLTNYSVNKNAANYKKNMDGVAGAMSPAVGCAGAAAVGVAAAKSGSPGKKAKGEANCEEEEEEEEDDDFSKPPLDDEELESRSLGSSEEEDDDFSKPPLDDEEEVDARVGDEGGDSDEDGNNSEASADEDEPESKWSLAELERHFDSQGWDYEKCFADVKALVVKTCISVEPIIVSTLHRSTNLEGKEQATSSLNSGGGAVGTHSTSCGGGGGGGAGPGYDDGSATSSGGGSPCFEIYGFDVLLDANLKPWLLEVNVSPSLSSSSPLDRRIKTMLLADSLTLVGWKPFDADEVVRDRKHAAKNRSRKLATPGALSTTPGGRVSLTTPSSLLGGDGPLREDGTSANSASTSNLSSNGGSTTSAGAQHGDQPSQQAAGVHLGGFGGGAASSSSSSSGAAGTHHANPASRKPRRLGGGMTNLLLGNLQEKEKQWLEFLRQFGDPEWRLIMEHVDEVYRRGELEPLFPRNKEAVLHFSEVLAIFYLCGGESILRSRKMQEKLGLHYLLQNKVLLTGWKV